MKIHSVQSRPNYIATQVKRSQQKFGYCKVSAHDPLTYYRIIENEDAFFRELQLPVVDKRAKTETILRKYRNQARAAADGRYLFDVGTDHQFVRQADFVSEIEEVFRHREEKVGRDDLSGVIAFGYYRWRLDKPNNAREAEENSEGTAYFVANEKAYVDYSVMKTRTAHRLGPFLETRELVPGTPPMDWWLKGNHLEMEYMERSDKIGLKRAFLKYPFLITFTNDEADQMAAKPKPSDQVFIPMWSLAEMKNNFGWLSRPVSSEELRRTLTPGVLERGRYVLSKVVGMSV